MCRLFGFRSNSNSTVHPELVSEKNSLRAQSLEHKDGWGIAYYGEAAARPQVAHGVGAAHADPAFEQVSSNLFARAVVAHVRLASVGAIELKNSHPFVYGPWTFAHNGTLREFDRHRRAIEARIAPRLCDFIQGETDSERCFYLFLSHLFARLQEGATPTVELISQALVRTVFDVASITDAPGAPPSSMNFLVCDGHRLVATRRRRTLYFSEGRTGAGLHPAPTRGARLEKLILASEELSMERQWHPVEEDSVIGVDEELRLYRWTFGELAPGPG